MFFFLFSRQARAEHDSKQKRSNHLKERLIIEVGDDIAANNKIVINLVLTERPLSSGGFSEPLKEVNSALNASVAPLLF